MCVFRKEANHQLAVAETYEEEKGKPMMVRIGFEKICVCSEDNLVNKSSSYYMYMSLLTD